MAINKTDQEPIISEEELKIPNRNDDDQKDEPHLVALLGVLVIVLILILAGLYLWSTSMKTTLPGSATENMDEMATTTNDMNESPVVTEETTPTDDISPTSNDIADIEAELESTDMEEFDAELESIDAEIEAALQ